MPTSSVRSGDGTQIAVERSGEGPPVVVVLGALNDRRTAAPLAAELAGRGLTVHTYDRRGRGDSGDTPPYAVEREVEDLAAVVAAAGGAAGLYGKSSGAMLIVEALLAGVPATKVALFEPPYPTGDRTGPTTLPADLTAALAAGRPDTAVELFLTRAVGLGPEAVAGMRRSPVWPDLEKLAPTLVYDTTIGADGLPADRLATVTVPALLLDSRGTAPFLAAATRAVAQAIPGAGHLTLDGGFHDVPPPVLAPVLADFFTGAS